MQFDEVLRTWQEFFEREEVRWAVIGGLAMRVWGRARLTNDLDIAVVRSATTTVVTHAESLGYETLFVSEAYSNHLHADRRLGRVDFMYLDDDGGGRIFDTAEVHPVIGDIEAPVVRPEYLAMMKGLAMKNAPIRALYEGEDVRVLLNVPGVDRKIVRDYFEEIGMLDMYHVIERAR